jgi:hypothetical protein
MQGLDYYMDGLLHEYLNQPDEDEEMPIFITDYYEEQE